MVLLVRIVVDRDLGISLSFEQLLRNVERLLQVALAICRGVVRTWETSDHLVEVELEVLPFRWPAVARGKVQGVGIPVQTVVSHHAN